MEAAEALSDAETEAGDDEGRPERLRLQYGSADPHCTGGSDRAPRASRAPPFAVHAHMPADASELEVRPMPAAIAEIISISSMLSALICMMPSASARRISRSDLPTPEKTIALAGMPDELGLAFL